MRVYIYVKPAKIWLTGLVFLTLFLILGVACSPAPASTPPPAPAPVLTVTTIEIANFAFSPATVTVPVGTTVTWINNDSATHTVTAQERQFDSGDLSRGASFSYTFSQSGTFNYYCAIHPRMTGKVIVQ